MTEVQTDHEARHGKLAAFLSMSQSDKDRSYRFYHLWNNICAILLCFVCPLWAGSGRAGGNIPSWLVWLSALTTVFLCLGSVARAASISRSQSQNEKLINKVLYVSAHLPLYVECFLLGLEPFIWALLLPVAVYTLEAYAKPRSHTSLRLPGFYYYYFVRLALECCFNFLLWFLSSSQPVWIRLVVGLALNVRLVLYLKCHLCCFNMPYDSVEFYSIMHWYLSLNFLW